MNLLLGLPLTIFRLFGSFFMVMLRFLPILLLLLPLFRRWRKQRSGDGETPERKARKEKSPDFDGPVYTVDYREVREEETRAEPDRPLPFAQMPGWLAVRAEDPEAVMALCGLQKRKSANWAGGLASVGPGRCFVSPSVEGWVLLVGEEVKRLDRRILEALSRRFSLAESFFAQEEQSLYGWVRFENGQCRRAYAMQGGALLFDEGELTAEEIALGFGRFPRREGGSREDFPTGDSVLEIAAAWGFDPLMEGKTYPPSAGWLCEL